MKIAPKWRQPTCPPAEEWAHKMRRVHTAEYPLAVERQEALVQAKRAQTTQPPAK